jgi:putative tryptophan/tyrosine transport system substrate-binding protein
MQRREFITLLGGAAAAWPVTARAQQPAMPAIGFLSSRSANDSARAVDAFRQGLAEMGYVEGRNAEIEFRWADGQFDRLPALASDLVQRSVAVLVAVGGAQTATIAKATTSTIPIIFGIGEDPIKEGLVPNLNRPGGNMTGATFSTALLGAKRLGILRDLVPSAKVIALLVNQSSSQGQGQKQDIEKAAREVGQRLMILDGSSNQEIDASYANLTKQNVGALIVGADPFFDPRRDRMIALSARYAVPTIYQFREFVLAGGLVSYGAASLTTIGRLVSMSVGFSKGKAQRTYRLCYPPSSSCRSISRPPKRSGLRFHRDCSQSSTR